MSLRHWTLCAVAFIGTWSASAQADVAAGLRVGTPGVGVDFDVGLLERLNLRVGYSYLSYDHTIDDTDVTYDGTLKLSNFSGILDWYAFGGGFRFSFGVMGGDSKVDAHGKPTNGFYEIGGTDYPAASIGRIDGKLEFGSSVAPYVGIGWGNPVSKDGRVTFLVDVGAIYGGDPDVSLSATCGSALSSSQCTLLQTQLQQDLRQEESKLEDDVSFLKWYPVLSIGVAVKF